jgi:ferredoxin
MSSTTPSASTSASNQRRKEPKIRSKEWAAERGLEPGYGGIWPGDPNAPTFKVTFRSKASGQEYSLNVPKDRYIFYVFEEEGIELPIINKARMCRQGCCTICGCKLVEGKVKMDVPLGLLKDMRDEGYILTCCSYPLTDCVLEVQTEDEVYIKQWAEGFEGGGVEWGGFLPDEDG